MANRCSQLELALGNITCLSVDVAATSCNPATTRIFFKYGVINVLEKLMFHNWYFTDLLDVTTINKMRNTYKYVN